MDRATCDTHFAVISERSDHLSESYDLEKAVRSESNDVRISELYGVLLQLGEVILTSRFLSRR